MGPRGDSARLQKETSCGRERERGGGGGGRGLLGEKLERLQLSLFSSFEFFLKDWRTVSGLEVSLGDPVSPFNLRSSMLPSFLPY